VIVAFRVSRVANREKPVAMREPRCAIRDYPHRSFHLGAAHQRPRRIANSFFRVTYVTSKKSWMSMV